MWPRATPKAPHTASPSVVPRKPLGIVAARQGVNRGSKKVTPRLTRRMRGAVNLQPRRTESHRQRLKMMCVMAARQGRNVECEVGGPMSSLLEDPEDIVVDCMKEVREDEAAIPVFVAADRTTGGGVSVMGREAHYVRVETQVALGEGE